MSKDIPFMHVGGGKPHFGIVLCIHVDSLHEIDFNPCDEPITKEIYLMSVLACSCDWIELNLFKK